MTFTSHYQQSAERLRREIENVLLSVGVLCRVFGRGKTQQSLSTKMANSPGKYAVGGHLIQDVIGIRIVLYFPENIEVVRTLLCRKYEHKSESSAIDLPTNATFSVTRYNLIFKLPTSYMPEIERLNLGLPFDSTFEVQIRSVLSEGWHEVDHDLRYKCPDHWGGQEDLSRALNGVVAMLETAEWTMRNLFDELSYRHYKKGNWAAMLHTKLRMNVAPQLSAELQGIFDNDANCAKEVYRIDRKMVIESLAKLEIKIPINLNNIVFLWNFIAMKDPNLDALTAPFLTESFSRDLP